MAARREGAVRHGRAVTTAASCREDTGETRRCARRDGPAPTLDDPDARHAIFAAEPERFAEHRDEHGAAAKHLDARAELVAGVQLAQLQEPALVEVRGDDGVSDARLTRAAAAAVDDARRGGAVRGVKIKSYLGEEAAHHAPSLEFVKGTIAFSLDLEYYTSAQGRSLLCNSLGVIYEVLRKQHVRIRWGSCNRDVQANLQNDTERLGIVGWPGPVSAFHLLLIRTTNEGSLAGPYRCGRTSTAPREDGEELSEPWCLRTSVFTGPSPQRLYSCGFKNEVESDSRKPDPDGGDILCDSDISSVTGVEKGVSLISLLCTMVNSINEELLWCDQTIAYEILHMGSSFGCRLVLDRNLALWVHASSCGVSCCLRCYPLRQKKIVQYEHPNTSVVEHVYVGKRTGCVLTYHLRVCVYIQRCRQSGVNDDALAASTVVKYLWTGALGLSCL
ncbi:hypothetical protein AURANDRAFT_72829 [Aureococcus anophagefferens]|uniref:Ig-like domain-containing protein n=1 Tax=Aureococcus anophagefferens TaxID=44056 RepID=F0YQ78_AURAN|nr:hypothetical protein AURANDRAFT_72829 [Aureococcus anophagefferens]EGB02730.1 hypothetical protein AURANDRAFT_72829 [Aureococcus anophagefferens]|eukprot:XP_009042570.1 hypothetical protein AURANDRAFT_72829 [Aureococcus anophagefferens]